MNRILWLSILGTLTGFAIIGGEAVFLRVLPTTADVLLALAVGFAAVAVSLALKSRLVRTTV